MVSVLIIIALVSDNELISQYDPIDILSESICGYRDSGQGDHFEKWLVLLKGMRIRLILMIQLSYKNKNSISAR